MPKSDPTSLLKLNRRQSLQLGAASTALGLLATQQGATPVQAKDGGGTKAPRSPAWPPFMDALPVAKPVASSPALVPPAERHLHTSANLIEAGRHDHQHFELFPASTAHYELHAQESEHQFHDQGPRDQKVWGFNGKLHGPTIQATYGKPVIVRFYNELPENSQGFGSPEISIHLHNLHASSGCDGFTTDYFSSKKCYTLNHPDSTAGLSRPGQFKDHHYPNVYAGFTGQVPPVGDACEALGTLWYHDHRVGSTAPNVYKGLAGFYLLFDKLDSGNENDADPQALRLPSGVGVYDIPLMFQDLQFDASGRLWFNTFDNDGFLGDKFAVNGKVQPYFNVKRRKYRFRLLDASVSRFYEFYLVHKGVAQDFAYIANDGNLLPAPLTMSKVRLGPSERGDIVIDFSSYNQGDELFIVNRLEQLNGRGPTGTLLTPGTPVLKFIVGGLPDWPDNSRVPPRLRELPDISAVLKKVKRTRNFRFDRVNGAWTVNGKLFDPEVPTVEINQGDAEIWELEVNGNWWHPIHIHFEEGRILSRNGKPPPPHEQGRKDTYALGPGEKVRVLLQFRDFSGKYMMHCHNTVHEDHDMMIRWDILPPPKPV
ncbi:multicopper oxidase domain-containing protein [Polaromonas sp.]|uniref:multicopper oxidase family protein n=1 Tax=Polaromonas sp. TaxID=1869339 RepID=UPI00286C9506|nr:multicopper oxidase domain-containing protein [Polaromonas sp.]